MKTSTSSELNLAFISDIHLGHRKNRAADIIKNLKEAFRDDSKTAELDIVFLGGDVFDDLLTHPSEDAAEIDVWIASFLRLMKKHDVKVRVLEGTPSHDWKQSHRFVVINEIADIGCELKHVKDLSIEYIQDCDITVLYVPDEWEHTTEKTLAQVHELLRAKGLEKVDYAVMHGQFEYQLPPFIKAQKHSSEEYLKIVRHLISIGHVHEHSRFDRIIAQGSFDCLGHGEEHPKGHVRARIRGNEHEVRFIENTGAKRYVTVHCVGMSLETTIETIDRKVKNLPDLSNVRIEASHDNPIFTNMDMLIRRYPLFTWSKLAREPEEDETSKEVEEEVLFTPITLTRENLPALLIDRLAASGSSNEVLEASRAILKEVM